MSEEKRLELENELLMTKSKAQMINLYLDKLEEIERLREENLLLRASEPMSKLQEDYGYKARIDKANRVLGETLIKYEDGVFRPIKNTSKQDVYKVVCKLYGILGTPAREGIKMNKEKEILDKEK